VKLLESPRAKLSENKRVEWSNAMTIPFPPSFRGLRWAPTSEQEVVFLFGRLLDRMPSPLTIEFMGTPFPDCKATDSETDKAIWIEFELKSSHFFRDHKMCVERCDWVVCWEDDQERPFPRRPRRPPNDPDPEIIALNKIEVGQNLILNPTLANSDCAEQFGLRLRALPQPHQRIIEQLLSFGQDELKVVWPDTNNVCFTVRGVLDEGQEVELFKVYNTSMIGIPFHRWKKVAPEIRTAIAKQLNNAIGTEWFRDGRKKSRDVAELMPDDETVQSFISVWRKLAGNRSDA
jgi:hypothetical protein